MKIEWNFINKCRDALFGDYWLVFFHGGRGGGKSHQIARYFIFESIREKHRYLCVREIQNSIEESVYYLLVEIIKEKELDEYYVVLKNKIYCKVTGSEFVFKGMQASAGRGDSIKSLEGFDRVWGEEAHSFSEQSIEKLLPTIRKAECRLFFSFNRDNNNDPIWKLSKQNFPKKIIVKINYYDNHFCPESLKLQAQVMKESNPLRYDHVYEGEPDDNQENSIIARKWVKAAFELYEKEDISGIKIVTLDVADEGTDANATCHRYGNAVVNIFKWYEGDTKQTTHKAIRYAKQEGFYPCKRFLFDRVGVGAGVRAEIKEYEKDIEIIPYNGGGEITNPDSNYEDGIKNKDMFENVKAQDWWRVRDLLENAYKKYMGEGVDDYIVINPDIKTEQGQSIRDELEDELCQVKKKESTKGKIIIDKKPKGCNSPNLADALCMAFSEKGSDNWGNWSWGTDKAS